jgi:hypothetical protein
VEIKSIADAVAVMDYLHKRALLCDSCGSCIAMWTNQFQSRCDACRAPHAEYKKAKVVSELERRIVGALQRWTAENPSPEDTREDLSYSPSGYSPV